MGRKLVCGELTWANSPEGHCCWAQGLREGAVMGRVALVAREHPQEGRSFHLKRVAPIYEGSVRERFDLQSDNPESPSEVAREGDTVVGLLTRVVRPEELAPDVGAELPEGDLQSAFGLSEAPELPWRRVDGHLFVMVEGPRALQAPDRVAVEVDGRQEAETAFILGRADAATN